MCHLHLTTLFLLLVRVSVCVRVNREGAFNKATFLALKKIENGESFIFCSFNMKQNNRTLKG